MWTPFTPKWALRRTKLLRHLQVDVDYPMGQTCCGQPMANAGFESKAEALAGRYDDMFKGYDYVVAPSASLHRVHQTQPSAPHERQGQM